MHLFSLLESSKFLTQILRGKLHYTYRKEILLNVRVLHGILVSILGKPII